jgi:hypothetical protein
MVQICSLSTLWWIYSQERERKLRRS